MINCTNNIHPLQPAEAAASGAAAGRSAKVLASKPRVRCSKPGYAGGQGRWRAFGSKSCLCPLDSLRGSSVKLGAIRRRLAWPLRKDDTHNMVSFVRGKPVGAMAAARCLAQPREAARGTRRGACWRRRRAC